MKINGHFYRFLKCGYQVASVLIYLPTDSISNPKCECVSVRFLFVCVIVLSSFFVFFFFPRIGVARPSLQFDCIALRLFSCSSSPPSPLLLPFSFSPSSFVYASKQGRNSGDKSRFNELANFITTMYSIWF